ncbi:MAG: peptidylprolyl isomerase [Gemmatimonadetes bacterium]|nr:peptidylprolyl isomerase [Gemmatimonadota bacterium]MDA1103509.1 peptidylprolyl isomerase [Gemmatimonadota bacterium]
MTRPNSVPARRTGPALLVVGFLVATTVAACGQTSYLYDPTPEMLAAQAPDSFVVAVETSEGTFTVMMHRSWSPLGVDRVYHLMINNFYAGARLYRVVDGFVAQWGFSGNPVLDSVWRDHSLPDEPTVSSNVRGVVSFARGGPETRSYTLFVNLADNVRLDAAESGGIVGYPPIGIIREGLGVIDGFYSAYSDRTPSQDSIRMLGNEYLRREYPQLDSIVGTRLVTSWR